MRKLVFLMAVAALSASAQTLINAAGATFPYPIYSKWFDEYHKKSPAAQINYQSVGSGAGIKQVTEGTVDFGATDSPMKDDQIKTFQSKHNGAGVLHFPTVMGAVVVTYNVPGVNVELNLTPEALAGIFLGRVTKWNDGAIAGANPGVKLPANGIVVVHRADASGTSFVFTDYLAKVSKEWETKAGRGNSVSWPVGLAGKGNEGVSGQVKQVPYSIGYVELIYAIQNKMAYARIKNAAGVFVKATPASVTAAASGAVKGMPDDFRVSITNAPGKDSYPISAFTWLLIPARIQDAKKRAAITGFLQWMLKDGQNYAEALNYAKLPAAVVAKEAQAIAKVQ